MDLTHPNRVFLNNAKRSLQEFPDQFSSQLPAPVQGLTRMTIETALIEYNPLHPTFPAYTSNLEIITTDVADPIEISVPTEVDWNSYEVNGQSSWPKNFEEFINAELASAGSGKVISIDLADNDKAPGFTKWTITTGANGDVKFIGQSTLANPEQSIMERLGLSRRFAITDQGDELTYELVNGTYRVVWAPTTTGAITPGNYILGRTSAIYVLSDLDAGASSDGNIQNILSVIPIRAGVGLGDIVEGEDTNSLSTSVNPSSDFNRIGVILLDDNYQPFELREEAKVIIELHCAYDRPDAVVLG
jgi:hypothetical protein